jgi:hypothetical protein
MSKTTFLYRRYITISQTITQVQVHARHQISASAALLLIRLRVAIYLPQYDEYTTHRLDKVIGLRTDKMIIRYIQGY